MRCRLAVVAVGLAIASVACVDPCREGDVPSVVVSLATMDAGPDAQWQHEGGTPPSCDQLCPPDTDNCSIEHGELSCLYRTKVCGE